jgi:agmatine deiminase
MQIIIDSTPAADGYVMPGEFEHHAGCIMVWPYRPGSWPNDATEARHSFTEVIKAIAKSERVCVAARACDMESACASLSAIENVEVFCTETDDAWARDIAPTFVVRRGLPRDLHGVPDCEKKCLSKTFWEQDSASCDTNAGTDHIRAINWEFNAWGGAVDGLYASWERDNAFAKICAEHLGCDIYDAAPFVLEGGSIHSDGEGTVMVTESCLLSAGRNPAFGRGEIESRLNDYLGASKILWLPRGIYNDETNEHVDNICAFIRPGEVVLAWTDNKADPQYELSAACLDYLMSVTDAKGRAIKVHKLPIPDIPITVDEEDVEGYTFEEGEDVREVGERLAASYVNFYFSNGAVVMPAFGGENTESDDRAADIMRTLCPEREIIQVAARTILVGGGNIHCITQQIPG